MTTSKQSTQSEATRSWHSDWGNLLLAGLGVYVAAYLLWLPFEAGSERVSLLIRELAFLPVMLLGVIFALRTALLKSLDRKTRRAWMVIGTAILLWLAGDGLWAYYTLTDQAFPSPSLADAAYLLKGVVLVVGILLLPAAEFTRTERTRFWLDSGIVFIALVTLTATLVIGPKLLEFTERGLEAFVLFGYPVTHTLALVALFSILARRPHAGSASVIRLLGAGILLYTITDVWWAYLDARALYVPGGVTYASWMIAQALLVSSPQRHYDVINRNLTVAEVGEFPGRLRIVLPYVAAAMAFLVLITTAMPELLEQLRLVGSLLVALLTLFIARQILTHRENVQLTIEQVQRESEERFQTLIEFSSDMITVLDQDLRCQFQSPSALEMTGQPADRFTATNIIEWIHPDDQEAVKEHFQKVLEDGNERQKVEWRMQLPCGKYLLLETIISNEIDNPAVLGLVLNSRDVTERKRLETQLAHLAYHDDLTGLPNRTQFMEALDRSLADAGPGSEIGVIFLDLDHFKRINDSYGHDAGDDLLIQVGERLQESLRPTDMLSRLAGDEFTILLTNLRSSQEAHDVAERVIGQLGESITISGKTVPLSPSIGISCTDRADTDPAALVRQADTAMYAAKRNGRARIELFQPWMENEYIHLTRDRGPRDRATSFARVQLGSGMFSVTSPGSSGG